MLEVIRDQVKTPQVWPLAAVVGGGNTIGEHIRNRSQQVGITLLIKGMIDAMRLNQSLIIRNQKYSQDYGNILPNLATNQLSNEARRRARGRYHVSARRSRTRSWCCQVDCRGTRSLRYCLRWYHRLRCHCAVVEKRERNGRCHSCRRITKIWKNYCRY